MQYCGFISCSSFSHVFWIDASSHESILASLKDISSISAGKAYDLGGSIDSVLQWISSIQEDWLIVFDNAAAPPEVVAKFFPPGDRGNILITSQNKSIGKIVSFENIIEINKMDEPDAIALLLKASHLEPLAGHLQVAKDIVTELDCIPLAVNQAGAYIAAGQCDIHEYLRQLSSLHQTLMSGAVLTEASVYRIWDLSFQEIAKRASGESISGNAQASQAAILILQICAFYHHSNISKDIFQSAAEKSRKHGVGSDAAEQLPLAINLLDHTLLALDKDGHWNDFVFEQGISVLLSFSLIKREQSSNMFSIHPLLQTWSQRKMLIAEQQRICQIGSTILSSAIPLGFTSQDYKLRRLIFPHIKANGMYASQMGLVEEYFDDKYTNFALVLMENGDWYSAEQLEVQVMNMRKNLLGAEHPDTLRSMGSLASTYSHQGRWDEAEQLEIQVMEMKKRLLGAEHPDTLRSMGNLASTYFHQGRWGEAEQLMIQVMGMMKRLLGAEHPDTLTSMGNLASTYSHQERWIEAEQLEIQVVEMMKKLFGAEHPDTLKSMRNLASIYSHQERWNEAEQLEIQVVEMMKKLFSAEHPDTLKSMRNLASTYSHQGRWNEAKHLEVQVLEMRKKLLGAGHPDTLTSIADMENIYHDQGRLNESEQLKLQL